MNFVQYKNQIYFAQLSCSPGLPFASWASNKVLSMTSKALLRKMKLVLMITVVSKIFLKIILYNTGDIFFEAHH